MTTYPMHPPVQESWYRGFIRGKTRVVVTWALSIALILAAQAPPHWIGITICLLGAMLRFWASGYLQKDSVLSIGGPYRFTRNPLYLGTFLMAVGTAASLLNPWLLLGVSLAFAGIYHYIILDEESKLTALFGEPYESYLKEVQRFFPLPGQVSTDHPRFVSFSWKTAWKNRAYEAFLAFGGLMGLIAAVAWLKSL